jgi:hypothetical protein
MYTTIVLTQQDANNKKKIFGLWAAARPWNPIPLNPRRTLMVLAGQFVALRNSWVIVSLDVWRVS